MSCVITGNWARYGGGIYLRDQEAEVRSTTISGNYALYVGGGVGLNEAVLVLHRSILWGDCAGHGDEIQMATSSSVEIFCSAFDPEGIEGDGTVEINGEQVNTDPIFCDPMPCGAASTDQGDYLLSAISPCLPDNSPCNLLIGALGQGCTPAGMPEELFNAMETSWGRIKATYRD
jgi:hypothetical protein